MGACLAAAVLVAAADVRQQTKYGKDYNGIDKGSVRFANFKANIAVIRANSP